MSNITLPKKDGRGVSQGWVQSDKRAHQAMWQFGLKNPAALSLLHFFTSRLDRGSNGVIMSAQAIASVTGIAPRTVQTSVKALSEAKLIQILKSGNSNVYIINSQVAWQGDRGARWASFSADITVSESEQTTPVDQLIEESIDLIQIPAPMIGERVLVGNEQIDPPDQQEMELP